MSISRDDLDNDRVRVQMAQSSLGPHMLTDTDVRASLRATLDAEATDEYWLFAYGSLIWNPLVAVVETRTATVFGFHRRLCVRSFANRGTPDQPGLVLGLDRGGSCTGLGLRLPHHCACDELLIVWRREMLTGAYAPRWVTLHTPGGGVRGITFVARPAHRGFAPRATLEDEARLVRTATGVYGRNSDYIRLTAEGLRQHGLCDRRLEMLLQRMADTTPESDATPDAPDQLRPNLAK